MQNSGVPPDWTAGTARPGVNLLADLSRRSCDAFGQLDVAQRRAHVGLVQVRRARVRQQLVDAAAEHHVAAEE